MQAVGSIFGCDASEGIDGSGGCEKAGGVERFETLPGSDELACNGFLEDRREENEVGAVTRLIDFGEGVAGDGDNGRRELSGGVEFADLGGA